MDKGDRADVEKFLFTEIIKIDRDLSLRPNAKHRKILDAESWLRWNRLEIRAIFREIHSIKSSVVEA